MSSMNQDLINYIQESKKRGLTEEQIKTEFKKVGWDEPSIIQAFSDSQGASPIVKFAQTTQPQPQFQPTVTQKPMAGAAQPGPTIIEGKRSWPKLILKIVLVVIGVAIIGGGALTYLILSGKTVFGYSIEDKIWDTLFTSKEILIADKSLAIAYQDSGTFQFTPSRFFQDMSAPEVLTEEDLAEYRGYDEKYSFAIKDLSTKLKTGGFANVADSSKPKFDLVINGSWTNNGTEYSSNLAGKSNDGETGFYKVGINDNLKSLIKSLYESNTAEIEKYLDKWIKAKNDKISGFNPFSLLFYQRQASEPDTESKMNEEERKALELIKKYPLFTIKSLKGLSTQGTQPVLHYALIFEKERFQNVLDLLISESFGGEAEASTFAKDLVHIIIDKWEIQKLEIWVGAFDHYIYKVDYQSNSASVTGMLNELYKSATEGALKEAVQGLFGARENSRDAKRLADVRQMMSALELFYNDNNGYPASNNGQPLVTPTYLAAVPTAPAPPDGTCNDFYNSYWYTPIGPKPGSQPGQTMFERYTLTFCVGDATGGYEAGVLVASETGIAKYVCPENDQACQAIQSAPIAGEVPATDAEQGYMKAILDFARAIPFTATHTIQAENKNLGVDKTVETPADFMELPQPVPYDPGPEELTPELPYQGI